MNLSLVLVIIGLTGIFAMSFGFPIVGICLQKLFRTINPGPFNGKQDSSNSDLLEKLPISIAVNIPAHNEASSIVATINSINAAHKFVGLDKITLQIFVGADGCNDETSKLAIEIGANVIESKNNIGKWRTIEKLFKHSQKSFNSTAIGWTAIVDAGTVWPENLLKKILDQLNNDSLIGISPSYSRSSAGHAEKISWYYERKLKALENLAGGPVSVHGATVFYKNFALEKTLDFLSGSKWTNDDVVVPLALRSLFKDAQIVYRADIKVIDHGQSTAKQEKVRRKRLVLGNLQWIAKMWLKTFSLNPVAACLAMRRICRVLWAYWLVAIAAAILISSISFNILIALSFVSFLLFLFRREQGLSAVVSVSLLSPIYFFHFSRQESIWK